MFKIRKLKKSIKGISPIIATLLLIAIAVVASLVVYLWVMGYIGAKTSTAGDSIMIPSFTTTNGYLTVYVQNTGQGIVHLDPSGSFYVNSTAQQITQENGTAPISNFPISMGQTIGFVTTSKVQQNDEVTIKAVTTEGTFIQVSGTVQGPATANYFTVTSTSGNQVAGTPFSVTVTATYPSGSPDTTYTGAVHFTSTDRQAVLPADYTFTAADAGVYTFNNAVTLGTAGTQSVTVTDTSTKITGSESFSVSHGAAASISVSPSTDSVTAGATVSYTATAKDNYGNTWDVSNTASWGPNNAGSWSGVTLTTHTSGTFTITAALPTASGTAQLTVNAGLLASLTVSGPSQVTAGLNATFTATGYDSEGNSLGTQSASWSIQSGAGGSWARNVYTSQYSGSWTATAAVDGVTGKAPLTVNAGSAKSFEFSSITSPQVAGTAFSVTITAQDAYGNTASSYAGTATLRDLNGPVNPGTAKFAAGVWTGSVNITKSMTTDALIATDSVNSSIAGESGLFVVNPGPLNHFAFSIITSPQTAGANIDIIVIAEDAYGNTVPTYTGTATLTDLSGSISPTSTGQFALGVWAGNVNITKAYTSDIITATNSTAGINGQSIPFTVNPASANHFGFSSISSPQVAGTNIPVTITAEDAYGNTVPTYTGTATLSDLTGHMTPTSATFTAGVWAGNVNITKAYTNDAITATDSSSGLTGTSSYFTVVPGHLVSFIFSSISSPQTAGTAFSVTITAVDQYGNTETSYIGPATLTDTSGSMTPTSATFTAGVWTSSSVTITKATTNDVITATDPTTSITGSSQSFTINSAAASSFSFSTISSPQTAGTAFSVTITAVDQYGNTETSYIGPATLTDTSGSMTPTSATFTAGVWTSSSVTITKATTNDVITATDSANDLKGVSGSFTINPGPLTTFTFSSISSPMAAGTAFSVTITAYDQYGNVETSYTGPTAVFNDQTGTLTSSGSWTAGVWTGTMTVTKVYTNDYITVTDLTTFVTQNSGYFTVIPGPLASFTISTISSPQVDTTAFSITMTAYDAYGNVETNYAGPAVLSDLSGSISPTSAAFAAGVYTGSVKITTTYTADAITVKDSSSGITASSNSFNVIPGVLDHFVWGTISSPQTAGTAFTITITAEDSSNDVVTGYTGSISVTDLSGTITLEGTGTFVNGVATGSVVITKAYVNDVITAIDSTTGNSGQSNEFNVVAGAATQLVYTAGAGQTILQSRTGATVVSSVITVQLEDAHGNPVTATSSVTVSLACTLNGVADPNGVFYSNAAGTTVVTSITIAAGSTSANFYFSDTVVESPVITASGTGLTSAVTTFTVTQYKLVFTTGASQTIGAGEMSTEITVERETATGVGYGPGGGITVTLSSSSSTGKFYNADGDQIQTTTIGGYGYNSGAFYYEDTSIGTPTLTASSPGYTSGTTIFTIYTPTLSTFTFATISSSQKTGTAFSITITAVDQNGHTDTGFTGTATLSSSRGTITTPTGSFTAGVWTGLVTITGTVTTPTGSTIAATSGSATGTSNSFTLYTPTLTSFSFSDIYGTKTAGTPFSVTITALDQEGNTVTSFTGPATLTETGGGAGTGASVNPSSVTFTNGAYTGNVYVTKAGTGVTITATSGTATGVSGTFTLNMGAPVSITVSPATDTVTAGSQVTYTATDTDAYGNTGSVTASVTWSITSGAGGSWTTNVYTSAKAGTWTVTATEAGVGGTASLTVNAGALAQFVFTGTSGTKTAGTSFSITITAEDAEGNTLTNYDGTATLTETGGGAGTGASVNPSSVTFTNGAYTGNVYVTKAGTGVTITATYNTVSTASGTFTVNPGTISKFAFSTISSPQTSTYPFSITITAEDAYGNTITTYATSVALSVSGGLTISPTSTGTTGWTNGVWTGSVTITGTGTGISIGANTNQGTSNTFTMSAPPPFGIDGQSTFAKNQHGGSLTLTTTYANDVIIVQIAEDFSGHTFTVSDTAGLTWHERTGMPYTTSDGNELIDEWYAIAATPLSSDTITVTESGTSVHNLVIAAYGISGAHTSAPFDTNGGLPYTNHGTSGIPTVTGVTTSNANDLILGFVGYRGTSTVETAATGFALISSQTVTGQNQNGAAEYEVVTSRLAGVSISFGNNPGSNDWAMFVDAIVKGP